LLNLLSTVQARSLNASWMLALPAPTPWEWAQIAAFCVMAVWVFETTLAIDQYVYCYAVQRWYNMDYGPDGHKPITTWIFCRGYQLAIQYHLGSLALSGLMMNILRPLSWLMTFFLARIEDAKPKDRNCWHWLSYLCCCCVGCWNGLVRFVRKEAYVVLGMKSENFFPAAQEALRVVRQRPVVVGHVSGATVYLQAGSMLLSGIMGWYMAYTMLRCTECYANETSVEYIPDARQLSILSGVLAIFCSMNFSMVFDTVCDTMVFCWVLDQIEDERQAKGTWFSRSPPARRNVPESLKAIIDQAEFEGKTTSPVVSPSSTPKSRNLARSSNS